MLLSQAIPESQEEDRCAICLNVKVDVTVLDGCVHEFCWSCIEAWSNINNACPLCKARFHAMTSVVGRTLVVVDKEQEDPLNAIVWECQMYGTGDYHAPPSL